MAVAEPLVEGSVNRKVTVLTEVNRAPGPKLRVSVRVVWYCAREFCCKISSSCSTLPPTRQTQLFTFEEKNFTTQTLSRELFGIAKNLSQRH